MFQILTILLFLYYLKTIFIYHANTREASIGVLDSFRKTILRKNSSILSQEETMSKEVIYGGVFGVFIMLFNIIEFTYIFFSVGFAPLVAVPVAYLVFWLAIFIKGILSKESKLLKEIGGYSVEEAVKRIDETKLMYSKVTAWQRIKSIIDCSFFGYMLYVLFFI